MSGYMNASSGGESRGEQSGMRLFYMNILIIVLVVIAYTFYTRDQTGMDFSMSEEAFTITMPDSTEVSLSFSDVTSMELVSDVDYGSCVSGQSSDSCYYGTWENETWGSYALCVAPSIGSCILVETEEQILVFNFESASTTSALYESLLDYVDI
ncbi:MAG: PH domain-containing protein [Clostridiales bacterium]|nr:PH domain-containing protein [Clostridiales bacterium]